MPRRRADLCNPRRAKSPKRKAVVWEARIKAMLPTKPDPAQEAVIRALAPLLVRADELRADFEETGRLGPDYLQVNHAIHRAFARLGLGGSTVAKDKSKEAGKGKSHGVDLEAILGGDNA